MLRHWKNTCKLPSCLRLSTWFPGSLAYLSSALLFAPTPTAPTPPCPSHCLPLEFSCSKDHHSDLQILFYIFLCFLTSPHLSGFNQFSEEDLLRLFLKTMVKRPDCRAVFFSMIFCPDSLHFRGTQMNKTDIQMSP